MGMFGNDDASYRKRFAPYIPVEDGGLMPAGQRDAIAAAMLRTTTAHPPSQNIEDRRGESSLGERISSTLDPRRWLYRTQMQPPPSEPPGPSPLGDVAGYWDVGDEQRPVDRRQRGPR
jgi:hypothetical protein